MTGADIYALWVVGCGIFALNGLLWLAHKNAVDAHRREVERARVVVLSHFRRKRLP